MAESFSVASTTELYAALSSAEGGDRIELAAGDYGSLNITGVTFSSDVTIVSADPANPAIVRDLDIRDSSHLVFDGILFDYVNAAEDPNSVVKLAYVYNSAFITIRNSVFDGDEVPSESGSGDYGTGFGLVVKDSDNVVIENNEFFDFYKALTVNYSTNIDASYNDAHSLRSDGFNFVSVDGLLVEGNWIHDFKRDPSTGDHADMIQFWTVSGEMASQNVIIRGNFLDTGTGDYTQALFMQTGLVGGSYEDDVWKNILIEDNVIYADHGHGITVGETDGLVVSNNTLLQDPYVNDPRFNSGWPPKINLNSESINVTVEGNITADAWNWETMTDQPGWAVGNNLLVQYDDPNGENYYGDLFVNPFAEDASLADLRAKAGGLIETLGIGAEMTRSDIDITLEVGPSR